jgi:6-phosphogluconolactonase
MRAEDAEGAAALAAAVIASACREAVAARGIAAIALSGGETPWRMLEKFRTLRLPWSSIFVAQIDERIAPRGDTTRNLTRMERILVGEGPLPAANLLAMPVDEPDPEAACAGYVQRLEAMAGRPPVLDLVQLGLGTDGHTASLVPGDPVIEVVDRDVAVTGLYQGQRRMTLTVPALARARARLWLVTGAAKSARLGDLLDGRGETPALLLPRDGTDVVADAAALGTPQGQGRGASISGRRPPRGPCRG